MPRYAFLSSRAGASPTLADGTTEALSSDTPVADPSPVGDPGTQQVGTTDTGQALYTTTQAQATCNNPSPVQAFAQYGDSRGYVQVPNGSFADKTGGGWTFDSADKIGGDGQSLPGVSVVDNKALAMPAGTSATSPAMCVDLNYPIFRFLARPSALVGLRVDVAYPDAVDPSFKTVATLPASTKDWVLSDDIPLMPALGGSSIGGRKVVIRFTALGANPDARWRIDQVYVDPWYR